MIRNIFENETLLSYALLRLLVRKMEIVEIRTATITSKGQISIPSEIRELGQFKAGNKVAIIAYEDRVEIRPLKEFNEKLFPALATQKVLEKTWLTKEEDEAWKDL